MAFPQVNPIMLTITFIGLHIHWLPCNSCNMLLTVSQGGLDVLGIMCKDGLWHIDKCPTSSTIQCFAMQKIQVLNAQQILIHIK